MAVLKYKDSQGNWQKVISVMSVTWASIVNKPAWIGDSKPTYAVNEITGLATALAAKQNDLGKGTNGQILSWDGMTDAPKWIAAPATGVTSFGGQTGAITLRGSQTAAGSVNLAMNGTQLQASIVGLGSAAYTASTAYATATQGSHADTAYSWGNHASAGYLTGITSSMVTAALGYTPADLSNAVMVYIYPSYAAARFTDSELAKKAAQTYIECWGSDYGWWNWKAGKWITNGGTSTHFVKGDGSLDGTSYQPLATAINTSNIGSQSVAYASNAGTANSPSFAQGAFDGNSPQAMLHSTFNTPTEFTNRPAGWNFGQLLTIPRVGVLNTPLAAQFTWDVQHYSQSSGRLWFRTKDDITGWRGWSEIIHEGNIASQSVAYASSIASHTLWGQTFNGTQDISGGLQDVTSITGRQITWNQLAPIETQYFTNTDTDSRAFLWLFIQVYNGAYQTIYNDAFSSPSKVQAIVQVPANTTRLLIKHNGEQQDIIFYNANLTAFSLHKIFVSLELTGVNVNIIGGVISRNLQVFDLTQMFGAGNEPSTVEQFRAMFPADYYPYNEGVTTSSPLYHGGIFTDGDIYAIGNILATGEVTAGSDARWKEDITPIADNPIMRLNPCEWDWKEGHGNGHSAGLIAQEVLNILPFAVRGNEDAGYTLNYNVFHAYEIAAIQSHETRIEALERENAELKKQLKQLYN